MRRKVIIILIIGSVILLTALVISYGKTFFVKSFIERTIKGTFGLRFSIDECVVSILNTDVRITDIAILNPKDFKDKIMFDIIEVYIDFDTTSFFKKRPYLKDLRINIDEIFIIKSKEGLFNLDALTVVRASREAKSARDITDVAIPKIKIESFDLKIKKVIYKDYSQPILPIVIEKEVNINERFENIEDPAFIARIILVEAIKKAALEHLLSINIQSLSKPIVKILGAAQQMGKGVVTAVQQTGKQVTEAVKTTAGKKEEPKKQNKAVIVETTSVPNQQTGEQAVQGDLVNDAIKR